MGYKVKQTFLSVFLTPDQQDITQAGMPVPPSVCPKMGWVTPRPYPLSARVEPRPPMCFRSRAGNGVGSWEADGKLKLSIKQLAMQKLGAKDERA